MKRLFIIGLSAFLIIALIAGCSNQPNANDAKAYVSFQEGSLAKALSTDVSVPAASDLYWSYDAAKTDGGNSYGAATGKALSENPGFSASAGPFSIGSWSFTLYGYADSARTVLVYEGSATAVLQSSVTVNVPVSARYVGADGLGYYIIDSITVSPSESAIFNSVTIKIEDLEGNLASSVSLDSVNGAFSQASTALDDGIYLFTYSFYDAADNLITSLSSYAVILKGRDTVISGTIDPSTASGTFDITIVADMYAKFNNYYYVLVDTPEALAATLSAAAENTSSEGTYIILDDDISDLPSIELTSPKAISFSSANVTVNLNGHTLAFQGSDGVTLSGAINLTIVDSTGSGQVKSEGTPITIASGASLTLNGGSVISSDSYAISTAGKVSIQGGMISGTSAVNVTSSHAEINVSGGKLVATDSSSKPIVGEVPSVTVGNSSVTDTEELNGIVALIPSGNETVTITLANDISGGGLVVPENRNIIFDLAGYSYTVGKPTVGSAGTETLGFQLLKGSNVEFRNGAIYNGGPCKILIQNYCNLVLDDVVVDATTSMTSSSGYGWYALSNNNGNTVIKGSTEIIADKTDDGSYQVAFDLYYWPPYYGPLSVEFDSSFTGSVTGTIEVNDSENAVLSIYGGTFAVPDAASLHNALSGIVPESGNVTLRLLENMTGKGFVVAENTAVTFDFNDYAYTISGTVGSAGTETNGFQLLKDADVTMMNGSILNSSEASAVPAKVMIQNYADLTLESMTIDGTTPAVPPSGAPYGYYVLSTNNGNISISGDTKLIANSNGEGSYYYAIPAYYWPTAGYGKVSVVFEDDFSGEVVGDISLSSDGSAAVEGNISIEINGGGLFRVPETNIDLVESFKGVGSTATVESL